MKLARIAMRPDHLGVITDDGVLDVTAIGHAVGYREVPTWTTALRAWSETRELVSQIVALGGPLIESFEAAVPILTSAKLLCVGLNYRRHALESGARVPDTPVIFSKLPNTLCVSNTPVVLPAIGREYDYEVELGVVIGEPVRRPIDPSQANRHIFGYLTANDLSARDLQRQSSQWLLGKSLDGFLPLAPWVTTSDSVAQPGNLRLRTWVNGVLRQDASTADMIFSVDHVIAYLSDHMTLEPGDLIITGTPEGVVLGMDEPRPWLRPGDIVEVEVEGLGRVITPLIGPKARQ